jgi:predicted metal-dependent TIM-barrel fold hydrolase
MKDTQKLNNSQEETNKTPKLLRKQLNTAYNNKKQIILHMNESNKNELRLKKHKIRNTLTFKKKLSSTQQIHT